MTEEVMFVPSPRNKIGLWVRDELNGFEGYVTRMVFDIDGSVRVHVEPTDQAKEPRWIDTWRAIVDEKRPPYTPNRANG